MCGKSTLIFNLHGQPKQRRSKPTASGNQAQLIVTLGFQWTGSHVASSSGSRRGRLLWACGDWWLPAVSDGLPQRMKRRKPELRRGAVLVRLLLWGLLETKAAMGGGGGRSLPQFSDDVPFRVNWPGKEFILPTAGVLYKEDYYIIMTTADKEKYKCILPVLANGDEEEEKDYKGPSPAELLEPLFKQSSCSYR
ncbi:endoplasmic reticulum lectin 1, partial [Python bivittatus]|uniref:Endoplasmic reticulum lectin n=1 Tax=Python bivittatus TaxID=176946 RepID=A0A9F2R8K4_PYTBI